jgi:hypothetical protein
MAYLTPILMAGLLQEEAGRWHRYMEREERYRDVESQREELLDRQVESMIRAHEVLDAKMKARYQAKLRGEGDGAEESQDEDGAPVIPVVVE